METIADFIAHVLVEKAPVEHVAKEVVAFRQPYQTIYYNFEYGLPEHHAHEEGDGDVAPHAS